MKKHLKQPSTEPVNRPETGAHSLAPPYRQFGCPDRLAADNHALTPAQRRGARLFFTEADGGTGGAGCFSCHSGSMPNKQPDDSDVSGVGQFVEENFYKLGLSDHPRQALYVAARNDPSFRDDGRREITGLDSDASFHPAPQTRISSRAEHHQDLALPATVAGCAVELCAYAALGTGYAVGHLRKRLSHVAWVEGNKAQPRSCLAPAWKKEVSGLVMPFLSDKNK